MLLDKLFATFNDAGNEKTLGEQLQEDIQAIQIQLDNLSAKAALCRQGRKNEIVYDTIKFCDGRIFHSKQTGNLKRKYTASTGLLETLWGKLDSKEALAFCVKEPSLSWYSEI